MGHLPSGDTDFFKFAGTTGTVVELVCNSARQGSGLTGFTVALLGASATPVKTGVETANADIWWSAATAAPSPTYTLAATGSFYFRMTTTNRSTTNTGDFYRCEVVLTLP
jgi:hypothetical protein